MCHRSLSSVASQLMIYAKDCDPTSWLKKDLTVCTKLSLFLAFWHFGPVARYSLPHTRLQLCHRAASWQPFNLRFVCFAVCFSVLLFAVCCLLLAACCSVAFNVRWMFDLSPDYRTKCHRLLPRIRIRIPIRFQFSFKPTPSVQNTKATYSHMLARCFYSYRWSATAVVVS